ncbi:hypothetical protein [Aeropyrum camini]|uniref:Uncharacterized protein n=1 Tax=Aeropyrum camini SY1 = JCM 12091 TaxID=1198449 RepID=U3TC35_9CREN|nr:hypothetical protein [Aeropyrum camini]BAN89600.1 hypothetical protein ACAM_0131 [Aeropyrum camini SY1 = JCM 12091]
MAGDVWRPPFSTGKIVEDYRLLKLYLEVAREKGREDLVDKALISEEDVNLLRRLSSAPGVTAEDLVNALEERFYERVDPDIASEALSRAGINFDGDTARRIIARILAGWLVEMGEELRMYRLRRSWEA